MLRLYWANIGTAPLSERAVPLSEYRKEKLRTVHSPKLRQEMLGAEWLLNRAVTEWDAKVPLPLSIGTKEKGKPFLRELPLVFSLSHSGPYIACAVADHEIGVDIQQRSTAKGSLLRRCFSERERAYIEASSDPAAVFTELWSMKESYVKALGVGLSLSFSSFSIELSEPRRLADDSDVNFWTNVGEDYSLSVCALDGNDPTPDMFIQGM